MYRFLLRAFPRQFRREFAGEMSAVFDDRRRDARRAGTAAHVRFLIRTFFDVVTSGIAERRAARRRKGDSPMRSFLQDIRFSFRLFRQRPAFTAAAVLTLALGIGINVAAFSIVDGVLLRWLPLPDADRVVLVEEAPVDDANAMAPFSGYSARIVDDATRDLFRSFAIYRTAQVALTGLGDAMLIPIGEVDPKIFEVMGSAPLLGRPLTADDAPGAAVVVSHRFWKSRLGSDPLVIGRTIELGGKPTPIVGVMREGVVWPANVLLWRTLGHVPSDRAASNQRSLYALGRLKPEVTLDVANTAAAGIAARLAGSDPVFLGSTIRVLDLRSSTVGQVRRDVLFAQAIAVIVLLIGCGNIANLLLANGSARQQEFSIRASIGAGRPRLIRQLLAESLVLSVLGSAAGVLLAMWLVPVAVSAYPGDLPGVDRVAISLREIAVAVGAAIGTALIFGVVPTIVGSRTDLASVLRAGPRDGGSRSARLLRWGLVAVEVVMTVTLLSGAGLLVRSYAKLTMQPIGFDPRSVLSAEVVFSGPRYPDGAARRAATDQLVERLRQMPGIVGVASAVPMPFDRSGSAAGFSFAGEPAPADKPLFASTQVVSQDYLDVFKVPLTRGRFFAASDGRDAPPVVVVNETFARTLAAGRDVLRTPIVSGGVTYTIVGVVADARISYYIPTRPTILLPSSQVDPPRLKLAIRTAGDPRAASPLLRDAIKSIDPTLPVVVPTTLESMMAQTVAPKKFNMALLTALAGCALALSLIGVYGVMAYVIGLREREMGVRLALGARPGAVQRLMVRQGLAPIVIGIAGGLGGAWYLTTLLRRELYEIKPHDPWPLAIASVGFLIVGLVACWLPSRRVARIDPASVLRAN